MTALQNSERMHTTLAWVMPVTDAQIDVRAWESCMRICKACGKIKLVAGTVEVSRSTTAFIDGNTSCFSVAFIKRKTFYFSI
jgi:hypothetical protein